MIIGTYKVDLMALFICSKNIFNVLSIFVITVNFFVIKFQYIYE